MGIIQLANEMHKLSNWQTFALSEAAGSQSVVADRLCRSDLRGTGHAKDVLQNEKAAARAAKGAQVR
jgi:hypothetical protein